MVYARTSAQRAGDFAAARPIEELVGSWLPDLTVANRGSGRIVFPNSAINDLIQMESPQ